MSATTMIAEGAAVKTLATAYPLIDLEKWSALDLLGNFDPNAANFDINSVPKPTAGALRPANCKHDAPVLQGSCYHWQTLIDECFAAAM
jgi:hypothetical protein